MFLITPDQSATLCIINLSRLIQLFVFTQERLEQLFLKLENYNTLCTMKGFVGSRFLNICLRFWQNKLKWLWYKYSDGVRACLFCEELNRVMMISLERWLFCVQTLVLNLHCIPLFIEDESLRDQAKKGAVEAQLKWGEMRFTSLERKHENYSLRTFSITIFMFQP